MASFRTWPDGEVLMLFDMTGVNGDDGTGAIARVLHSKDEEDQPFKHDGQAVKVLEASSSG